MKKWWPWLILLTILLAGGVVRLYRVNFPLADWHSFRQVDTAAVTREFRRNGIDLLHPRYHDVSNIQSGQLNLAGWRMVEFPLLNAVTALILQLNTNWSLVVVSRLVSIGATLITMISLAYVFYRLYGWSVSLLATGIMAFMPYNIYFTRTVLPEPFMMMWWALAAVAILEWARRQQKNGGRVWSGYDGWLVMAAVCWAVALLVKPTAVFLGPFLVGVAWRWRQWQWWPWLKSIVLMTFAVGPLWWWREWIQQYPAGIPAADWLLNGNNIRLRPAWWRWLGAERLGKLMFGYWGALWIMWGLFSVSVTGPKRWHWRRAGSLIDAWLQANGAAVLGSIGLVAYVVIVATGNVQHDYYQILLVPIVSLLAAQGVVAFVQAAQRRETIVLRALAAGGTLLLSAFFAWNEIKGNFNVNNWTVVTAGQAVQRHTRPEDLVIAHYNGDTTLLFYTERHGWPIGFSIDEKIAAGAKYYVSTALDDEANDLMQRYRVLEKAPDYVVIDLQTPVATAATPRVESAHKSFP